MLPLQQQMLGNPQAPIPPPPPQQTIPNPNDLSLAGVLHFLQTEWRRYERERNEWEIERAEMRARIALLEGERRSFENIKIDLLRRVKMMEYALRVERSKQLQQPISSLPAKPPSIKDEVQGETAPPLKEGSGSNSPRSEDAHLPNTSDLPNGPATKSAAAPAASQPLKEKSESKDWTNINANNLSLSKAPPGRDPRSRARSRDYLKQCLLELSYLTSPQAMNPLPNRQLLNTNHNASNQNPNANLNAPGGNSLQQNANGAGGGMQGAGLTLPNLPNFGQSGIDGRVKKTQEMGKDFSMANGMQDKGMLGGQSLPGTSSVSGTLLPTSEARPGDALSQIIANPSQAGSSSGSSGLGGSIFGSGSSGESSEGDRSDVTQLTAIFRPDDQGAWKEALRQQREQAQQNQQQGSSGGLLGSFGSNMNTLGGGSGTGGSSSGVSGWDLGEEGAPGVDEEADEDELLGEEGKKWKVRKTLRNHLDSVRAVSFHPKEMILATGGDDLIVKIWRMDATQLASANAGRTVELEPQTTLRGHSAPVTSLAIAPHRGLVYSASLDSTIRVWSIPGPQHTTYSPYDPSTSRGELVGHTDAVWGLSLMREGSVLVSVGADGWTKVWDVGSVGVGVGSLRLTWGYAGTGGESPASSSNEKDVIGATAVESIKSILKWVAVGYRDAVTKIFEVDTGKEVSALTVDGLEGGPATQVNAVVSHPALPLLVVGYEDKNIRIFDLQSFTLTHSLVAHLDAVTSLSIDPSGHSLVSGSHDNSVRFWDLLGKKECIQEDTKHRGKGEEGVLAVQFHASLPFLASAGADGLVKIWASS